MTNSVRGSHSSPGVYTREIDYTFTAKSLGITRLGLAGETLKGPAFEPIKVERWSDFETYFGGTSAEKFKGTGYPKYELPYIAQEYLKESSDLEVCRVLGLSGYDAGDAFPVYVKTTSGNTTNYYIAAVLRSKKTYSDPSEAGSCDANPDGDVSSPIITSVTIGAYQKLTYNGNCEVTGTLSDDASASTITAANLGKFTITAVDVDGKSYKYPVSFNYNDKDYIYNVIGSDPRGSSPIYVEYLYDYAIKDMVSSNTASTYSIVNGSYDPATTVDNYKGIFQAASTPWIVSDVKSDGGSLNVKRLFKLHTISDGKASNREVKVSIQNIKPDDGTFDLVVRAFNDSDNSPVILEKFSKLSMTEGDANFIGMRIGTIDGSYELKSKYIMVELPENSEIGDCVPCGFEGYPLHASSAFTAAGATVKNFPVSYNCDYDRNKKAKKQYFGFSTSYGVDEDILAFKGSNTEASNGFHLDSILSSDYKMASGTTNTVYIDGQATSQKFTAVSPVGNVASSKIPRIISENYMKGTIYEDVNLRKFTVCFQGGFDGWDENRDERTTSDKFKTTKYNGEFYDGTTIEDWMNLPTDAKNSDYYAYLAAYRQFANPQGVKINVFATPGIDFVNNELLVEDALDMIEDSDDGRGGDALYVMTTPDKPSGATDAADERYTAQEVVDLLDTTSIDSSYVCTYWPWVKILDSGENKYINLPVTKDVVRNMAMIDNKFASWYTPAGTRNNKGYVNCVRATMKTKIADEDTLYDGMINPVKTFAEDGVYVWGNKTVYRTDSPLNRINARRLLIRLKDLVVRASRDLVFEQYDSTLKTQFEGTVKNILADVKKNRGISDYRVSCDDSAENRDAHVLPGTIAVKPINSLEWIELTFAVYPESVDFNE